MYVYENILYSFAIIINNRPEPQGLTSNARYKKKKKQNELMNVYSDL